MLHRSQPSGAQNRKRKKNQQESERALHGSMDGFVIKTKKNNNSVAQNNDKVNVMFRICSKVVVTLQVTVFVETKF